MNINRELAIYRHLCIRAHEALMALRECDDGSWQHEAANVVWVILDRLVREKEQEIAITFDADDE